MCFFRSNILSSYHIVDKVLPTTRVKIISEFSFLLIR